MAETVVGSISENNDGESSSTDFQSAITQALKDLSATSENLQVKINKQILNIWYEKKLIKQTIKINPFFRMSI